MSPAAKHTVEGIVVLDPPHQLGQKIGPVETEPRCTVTEAVQQWEPSPPWPERNYEQDLVVLLKGQLGYQPNQRKRRKGI